MSTNSDVHVRICRQELIKHDLEIKALIQVTLKPCFLFIDPNFLLICFIVEWCPWRLFTFSYANASLKFQKKNKEQNLRQQINC